MGYYEKWEERHKEEIVPPTKMKRIKRGVRKQLWKGKVKYKTWEAKRKADKELKKQWEEKMNKESLL